MSRKIVYLHDVPLFNYTTYRLGGKAKDFFVADTLADLIKAYNDYNGNKIVLGRGSNVLVSDDGFNGLVIINRARSVSFLEDEANDCVCSCASGVLLSRLSRVYCKLGFNGLAKAALIPGTVGGAIKGNAGAFSFEISDLVKDVTVLQKDSPNSVSANIKTLSKAECAFSYRKSDIHDIILSATFLVDKGDKSEIDAEVKKFAALRRDTQPFGLSAGSVFKRVNGIGAGYYIERASLKGEKIGGAEVSAKHANFICSNGFATARDVYSLIQVVKKRVKDVFNIDLEEEIVFVGKF